MSAVILASYAAAFLLNASQVLKASAGMLGLLPEKYRWIPSFVLSCVPPIAGYFGVVKTNMDLVTALALSGSIVAQGLMTTNHAKAAATARTLQSENQNLKARLGAKEP